MFPETVLGLLTPVVWVGGQAQGPAGSKNAHVLLQGGARKKEMLHLQVQSPDVCRAGTGPA